MKPIFYCTAAFFLAAALPAQAATYICRSEGRAVFTTEKLGRRAFQTASNNTIFRHIADAPAIPTV